ncbi:hypothetical protein GA0070606_5976 [Micromonospora citrea]|uniref:Signal transduction histidine kinase n=1 Tax=Micromonospora citrea TaxID=47855 RepID=A0A1C6W168_9ACTN|nr:hypothetical protein [Micromonospora citrea]SCL72164.1 hypothetical protein GA0070606_5976 [Micromonospora citrea]
MAEPLPHLMAGKLLRGLRLATLAIAATTLFGFALPLLVANPQTYSSLARQVLAFAILTVVVVVAGVRILRDEPLGRPRRVLVAAVVVAAALATTGIPAADLMSEEEWSYGVIGWFGLLLLVDRSVVGAAVFLGAYTVASFTQLALVGQRHETDDLVVVTVVMLGCELPVLAGAVALRGLVAASAAATADAERVRTAEAIAEHLHADRRSRCADLTATAMPLLADLARGSANLGDERVRGAYAVAAARLRRLFAEHDEAADPLLHELRACLDPAERNGVAIYIGTCGAWPTPPLAVRRALTDPALRVTARATSQARVTVLGSTAGVTVSVLADVGADELAGTDPSGGAAGHDDVAVNRLVDGSRVWVEATWRPRG